MHLCCAYIVVVVFWAVDWLALVDMPVHFRAYSQDVEVRYAKEFEFNHQWPRVRSRWHVFNKPDKFFLCSDQWLKARAVGVVRSPYGDGSYEVGDRLVSSTALSWCLLTGVCLRT